VAGLVVPHFHQHVFARTVDTPADVPWHESDDWSGARRGTDDDIAALCTRLRAALDDDARDDTR
jgi:ATP adenylyltransferase